MIFLVKLNCECILIVKIGLYHITSMTNLLSFKYQVSFSVTYEMDQREAYVQTDVSFF